MLVTSDDFSLSFSRYGGTVSVAVVGELDCSTAPQLRSLLFDVIEGQGNLSVVVDLSRVSFIGSAGLSALIAASKVIREAGGTLILTRPRPSARRVFEITGLDKVVTVTV